METKITDVVSSDKKRENRSFTQAKKSDIAFFFPCQPKNEQDKCHFTKQPVISLEKRIFGLI